VVLLWEGGGKALGEELSILQASSQEWKLTMREQDAQTTSKFSHGDFSTIMWAAES